MPRRYEDVVRQLTDDIVGGVLAAGAALPPAAALSEELGTGRGVVREALRALEARGLVEVRPGRDVRVRHGDTWPLGDPAVLQAVVDHGDEPGVLAELIALRAALERDAAADAARRATAGDLTLLRGRTTAIARSLEARPGTAALQEEIDFHHALSLIGGNRVRASVALPMHRVLATCRARDAADRAGAFLTHHRRILEGVSSREPDLAAASVDAYARALTRWMPTRR